MKIKAPPNSIREKTFHQGFKPSDYSDGDWWIDIWKMSNAQLIAELMLPIGTNTKQQALIVRVALARILSYLSSEESDEAAL